MTTPTTDDLLATWTGRATDRMVGERDSFTAAVLDRLADGLPADVDHLAAATGLDHHLVQQRIAAAAAIGYETRDGAIVGAALTLNPTAHRFSVRGRQLQPGVASMPCSCPSCWPSLQRSTRPALSPASRSA